MKTALSILILLALTIGPSLLPQFCTQAIAANDGCCNVRQSLIKDEWDKKTYSTLGESDCKKLNEQADGGNDKHTEKTGYIWWEKSACK